MTLAEQLQAAKLKKVTPNASREPSPIVDRGMISDMSASVINPTANIMAFSKHTKQIVNMDQSVIVEPKHNATTDDLQKAKAHPAGLAGMRRKTVMQQMTEQLQEALKKKENDKSDDSSDSGSQYSN